MGLGMDSNKVYEARYPNKGDTSCHNHKVHLRPLICIVYQAMHCNCKTT